MRSARTLFATAAVTAVLADLRPRCERHDLRGLRAGQLLQQWLREVRQGGPRQVTRRVATRSPTRRTPRSPRRAATRSPTRRTPRSRRRAATRSPTRRTPRSRTKGGHGSHDKEDHERRVGQGGPRAVDKEDHGKDDTRSRGWRPHRWRCPGHALTGTRADDYDVRQGRPREVGRGRPRQAREAARWVHTGGGALAMTVSEDWGDRQGREVRQGRSRLLEDTRSRTAASTPVVAPWRCPAAAWPPVRC